MGHRKLIYEFANSISRLLLSLYCYKKKLYICSLHFFLSKEISFIAFYETFDYFQTT